MATHKLITAAVCAATLVPAAAFAQNQMWMGGPTSPGGSQYMYSSPGPNGGRITGGYLPDGRQMWNYTPNRRSLSCADLGTCTTLPRLPQPGDDDD